jgi:hypothetical protein
MNSILDILDEAKKKKVVVPVATPKKKKKKKIVYVGNANKYGISDFKRPKRNDWNDNYNHGLRDKIHKKTILPPKYKIDATHGNYYWIVTKEHNNFALFNPQGKNLTDFMYRGAWGISNKFIALKDDDDVWTVCDTNGKKVLPDEYDQVDTLEHPKALSLIKDDGTIEHRDIKTLKILSVAYDEVLEHLTKDILIVSKDDQVGMYNKKTGNMILPTNYNDEYETIRIDKQLYVILTLGNRQGMVDANGNIIIPFNYQEVNQYDTIAFKGDHLMPVTMGSGDENLFSFKHHRNILNASYDEIDVETHKGFLYIAGTVGDEKRCGVVKYDGNKTTTVLPNVFSNVDMDINYNEIDASFDNNNHTYSFDLDGRPKGEVNKKLIRDIFRYIK